MKDLNKLAVILRGLGISAKVDDECKDNTNLVVTFGRVELDIWHYPKDSDFMPGCFEIHLFLDNVLFYDGVYTNSIKGTLKEILDDYYKYVGI